MDDHTDFQTEFYYYGNIVLTDDLSVDTNI